MSDFRADLHCHSTCSDGSDDPSTLLYKAKEIGLSGLSITDHDSIAAYTDELFALAGSLGVRLLPGVELSSTWKDQTVHVLGYGFAIDSPVLSSLIAEIQSKRKQRNRLMLEKLKEHGIAITEDELMRASPFAHVIGRPHIASLMVQKGFVATFQQAFDGFLSDGAPCYVPGFKLEPQEVIGAIQSAKGKAVLAHPHLAKDKKLIKEILNMPFDGIECYYGNLQKSFTMPWVELAKKKGWIATGGSDYHGAFKPHILLGASWVGKDVFEQLM